MSKGNGTALPGLIARRIDPEILSGLSGMVREKMIVTMGTNGKTTSNNLLCRSLEAEGKKVICNRMGANMENGIVSAFVLAAGRGGYLDADYACIEVDELTAPHTLPLLNPDCILLTNIFRDQLDRYGEIDVTCRKIKEAVTQVPKAVLVINGDDIFSYALALECKNPIVIYGINEHAFSDMASEGFRDSLFCRFCGSRLFYDFFHYGHLGIYHCPDCGMNRPAPSYTASDIQFHQDGCSFCLNGRLITARTQASYSIYNILSSYATLCAAKAPVSQFANTVLSFDYGNHREKEFFINGTHVQLYLVKNPVGFQQKLTLMQKDSAPKDIIFQINDNCQDGRDISWLWDVNFEGFSQVHAVTVLTAGLRRYDMALRLKYENILSEAMEDMETAVKQLIREGVKNLYVVVNYSSLYQTKHLLENLSVRRERDYHETDHRTFIS